MSSPKFNFNLKEVPTELIGDRDKFFVIMPVYGDLLAQEYQALEELEKTETVWMGKLLDLAGIIADRNNIDVWEVISKLEALDTMTTSEKSELMGDLMPRLVKLETEKLGIQDRLTNTALVVLQSRIASSITMEDVLTFPQKFLKEINDFIAKEQAGGSNVSYASLKNQYDILLGKATLGEQLILLQDDYIEDLLDIDDSENYPAPEEYEQAKTAYWEYENTTKKLGL